MLSKECNLFVRCYQPSATSLLPLATDCYILHPFHFVLLTFKIWLLSNIQQYTYTLVTHAYNQVPNLV